MPIRPVYPVVILCLAAALLVSCGGKDEPAQIDAFLENSANYLDKGQFNAAIIEARSAIQAAPQDPRGHLALARIFIDVGQPREAVNLLERLESKDPDSLLMLARAYLNTGKVRSASDLLVENRQLVEGAAGYPLLKADVEMLRGNVEDARALFESVRDADPGNIDARLGLARIAIGQAEWAQAEAIVDEVLVLEPQNARALLFASTLKSNAGDLEGAETLLMDAISATPSSEVVTPLRYALLVALRDNLTRQGKTNEAMIYSELLAESNQEGKAISDRLQEAMNEIASGNLTRAREILVSVQEQAPGSAQVGTMLGVLEYLEGNNDAAVRQFDQFVDPEIAAPTALQMFAIAELRLNQPERVLERLKADIDMVTDARVVALYGIAAVSAGDIEQGEKYLLKSVELNPDDGRLRMPLVRLYNTRGNTDAALDQLQAAFRAQPQDPLVQAGLVQQLVSMGRSSEAEKVIDGLRASYPRSQETQVLVADFYLGHDKPDLAMEVLEKALELGNTAPVVHMIARIHLIQRDLTSAANTYRELIAENPEDSVAYKGLITAFELEEKADQGVAEVMKYAEKQGVTAPALVLAEYYGRRNEFGPAFEWLGRAPQPPGVEATRLSSVLKVAQAQDQFRQGRHEDSRVTVLEALQATPDDPQLLALLINLEIAAKNFGEAERVLGQLEKLQPNSPGVIMLGGDIAVAKADHGSAARLYRKAWQQVPSDALGLKLYGALRQTADSEEIESFLGDWSQKLPNSQLSVLTAAGHLLETGQQDKARKEYEAILATNPDNAVAHNNLAWIYGEAAIEKALASSKRAYELAPQSGEIVDSYGWFLYKSGGDVEKAKELLAEAIRLSPQNAEIQQHYSEVFGQERP